MQLGGRTRRKTTAGGAHLLEAGSLTGFAHGDRTHSRPKSSSESLASSVQPVSHRVIFRTPERFPPNSFLSNMLIACLLASTVLLSSFLHGVQPSPALELDLANVT